MDDGERDGDLDLDRWDRLELDRSGCVAGLGRDDLGGLEVEVTELDLLDERALLLDRRGEGD